MRTLIALILSLAGLAALPTSVAACTPHVPTFADVLATDSTIVLGRVVEESQPEPYPAPPEATIEVERLLRGQAGERVVVKDWATFCRDALPVGRQLIVVVSMRFGDPPSSLAPYIEFIGGKPNGVVEEIPRVQTLDELADRIAALPDTATDEPAANTLASVNWLAVLLGLLTLVLVLARPFVRGRLRRELVVVPGDPARRASRPSP